jgi:tetratricopeptide (TPR) repeat protein
MGTTPSPHLTAPGRVGPYSVHRKLGSGSLGTVYLVRDPRRRRLVALKVLRTDRLTPEAVGRLQKEFRAIASLHHEQIATAHDFGYTESGRVPFYTREYVQGTPLPPGPPGSSAPAEFLRPILDLLDALEYLHAHGILHLDIHPGNIIVAEDKHRGSVLIDFGVIPSAGGTGLQTGWEPWSGMPPEMLGRGAPSLATDIFLAGRVLHYRLTGDARGEVRLPREIPGWGPRLTLEIERIAGKALQPDPRQRFASAREFREALARAIGEPRMEPQPSEPREITLGRDVEIQAMEDALRDVLSGKSRVFRLSGPPGSGKTHLLGEARVRAQLRGLEVVEASFFPGSGPGFLRAAFESARAARRGKTRWLEPLSAKHGGTPEERARRAAKAFFDDGGGPLVLIADDLELADGESRLLAEALLAEVSSLGPEPEGRSLGIFVATARPPGRGARRRDVRFLKPLRAAEAGSLLEALVRPLVIPGPLLKKAAAEGRGSPLRLHEIARALTLEWSRSGVIPPSASLPSFQEGPAGGVTWAGIEAPDRELLSALAFIGRPASPEEIAAALERNLLETRKSLMRVRRAGLVTPLRHGRGRRYRLSRPPSMEEIASCCPGLDSRMVHARLARFLGASSRPDLDLEENLARHLLLCGKRDRGFDLALSAASRLRERGQAGRAVRLLEEASSPELPVRERLRVAEEISSILEETGDHLAGISVIEPFYRGELGSLSRAEAVRVRRRLGVHYHRGGEAEKALAVFEETQAAADPVLDLEDLVFVDSELAELHTLRGEYGLAEEACKRGLARLEKIEPGGEFRARMEVTLRASLGHLDLRRMDLKSAQAELQAAARLSRRLGLRSGQPAIFNNLGIVENQLNNFAEAERAFRTAEKLLLAAGEGSGVVSISCNLAVLAAKRGDRDEASLRLERAAQLLRRYPGQRLEFFVGYTRGVVAHLFGDPAGVAEALQAALPLARKAGDVHLARFGEVYLADAHLASGRYLQGLKLLRSTARHAEKHGPDLLRRAAHGRLSFLEAILGRARAASRSRRLLDQIPRTSVVLVEAWNDLWMGLANVVSGESGSELFRRAREVFSRLKVPCGERLASLGILLECVARGDREALRGLLSSARAAGGEHHRLLSVAEPLLRAEALWLLGDTERAKDLGGERGDRGLVAPGAGLEDRASPRAHRTASRRPPHRPRPLSPEHPHERPPRRASPGPPARAVPGAPAIPGAFKGWLEAGGIPPALVLDGAAEDVRVLRGDGGPVEPDGPGLPVDRQAPRARAAGSHLRRDGLGKGARRQGPPPDEPEGPRAVPCPPLRFPSRGVARVGAVRLRGRRLHGGRRAACGPP